MEREKPHVDLYEKVINQNVSKDANEMPLFTFKTRAFFEKALELQNSPKKYTEKQNPILTYMPS